MLHWCSINSTGHSGDRQEMQLLLIFCTSLLHAWLSTPPPPDTPSRHPHHHHQGAEKLLIKPPSSCRSSLLIEKKIVSIEPPPGTGGGGGCIRRGNRWGGGCKGVGVGGWGVYSTCCLHPGFTKEINILLLTVLDCSENKEGGSGGQRSLWSGRYETP